MKIKLYFSIFLISLSLIGCGTSASITPKSNNIRYQSVALNQAILLQKGKQKNSCIICGMDLAKFYKTSHIADTKSGITKQYCSIHCVVQDNEINKTDLKNLQVVDNTTLKFISSHKAYYVVGSSKPGTMSRTSKYAFAKKSDANAFVKKFGGKIMNLNDTYTVAMKDFK
jgi:nitrous oxide reductase accessory protein NosL